MTSMVPSFTLVWGSPEWLLTAGLLLAFSSLLVLWSYARSNAPRSVIVLGAILKTIGLAALAFSLVEPLLTGSKPKKGANAFVVVADNSQSLLIRDDRDGPTRGDWIRGQLAHEDGQEAPWRTRLGQDFDVRRYVIDSHLRGVDNFDSLKFDGTGSALNGSLAVLSRRFRGLPLAGILLFTDANATDRVDLDWSQLPPIYPVAPPSRNTIKDIGVTNVSVSQTNFESAPVVVRADVNANGFPGEAVVAAVTDESGKVIERQEMKASDAGAILNFRFQFRPEKRGIHFYRVHAYSSPDEARIQEKPRGAKSRAGEEKAEEKSEDEESLAASTVEQTLANNSRLVLVDQGGGPYRVLYVSGRPNWEFKFLRRAVDDDEQIILAGLLRLARSQPKFDFRDMRTKDKSNFFKGFDNPDEETAERQDQPVLVRLGKIEEAELRDGFPKSAADLYRYHAIVIDDLESSFFTQDQLTLLRNFVSARGGGLLMLGGPDSFADGRYDRTPVGDLLPVYLNRSSISGLASSAPPPPPPGGLGDEGEGDEQYRLVLTREGWLQPWVRTRKTEDEERRRLETMPPFHTLSRVGTIKPGAVVLAQVLDSAGASAPALVAQSFGNGQVAALLVGDLWRWGMHRKDPNESDLERAWRQTVRWLVANVPSRVDLAVRPKGGGEDAGSSSVEITARVRDAEYRPLDNARVSLKIIPPEGGEALSVDAEADPREPGTYVASHVAKTPGGYRIVATATAPDGSAVGEREAGWAAQPSADEFARLTPDREYLKMIAEKTRGEVIDHGNLDGFARGLASRSAPITEPWISPLWHHPAYFALAILCLTAEWGLRRVNGLA